MCLAGSIDEIDEYAASNDSVCPFSIHAVDAYDSMSRQSHRNVTLLFVRIMSIILTILLITLLNPQEVIGVQSEPHGSFYGYYHAIDKIAGVIF